MTIKKINKIQVENNDTVSFILDSGGGRQTIVCNMSRILPQIPTYISYTVDTITIAQGPGSVITFYTEDVLNVGGNSLSPITFSSSQEDRQDKTIEIYRLLTTSIFKGCCDCGCEGGGCSIAYRVGDPENPGSFFYDPGSSISFSYTTANSQDFSGLWPIVSDGTQIFLFSSDDPTVFAVVQITNYTDLGTYAKFDAVELNSNGVPFVDQTMFCVNIAGVVMGGLQGFQDVLIVNSVLTQDNDVDVDGNKFQFIKVNPFVVQSSTGESIEVGEGYVKVVTPNYGTASAGDVLALNPLGELEYVPPSAGTGTVTSVDLSVPPAFSVSGNPITTSGTLVVTGAGVASQYVRGDGTLANFPSSLGGGASVNYYLNGGTNQGTFSGDTYYEMSQTAVFTPAADFSIAANGYIANFITDANDPNQLLIPGGNWIFDLYFSASSPGGSPSFYVELYKWDGASFTLIASSSATPEAITNGTAIDLYTTALSVPPTTLALTDRLAVRVYVDVSGRTITMHTQDSHLSEVITTFSTGITALNGLTSQIQTFATGTSGTDFAINSSTSTHTFNLPVASSSNTGKLSSTDWSTFNDKVSSLSAGTGISIGGTTTVPVVTNTAPDQTVSLGTTGSGLSVTGTYPNFTLQNTLPDQTVALTAGTGIGVSGTYPSFTITNTAAGSSGTVTSVQLAAGTGISLSGTNPITTSGTITVTNSSPDQTVVLTQGTGVTITGTYPNFTIAGTPAIALQTPYVFGSHGVNASLTAGQTLYWTDRITGAGAGVLANRQSSMTFAGTGDHLQIRVGPAASTQPASGSLVWTVQKNGVDTALTRTIAANSVAGVYHDVINSFTFVDDDLISIKAVNNATAASIGIYDIQFNTYKT